MKIFSISLNAHDHSTYDGIWHNQIERFSRRKHNIPWHQDVYAHHSELSRLNGEDNRYAVKFYDEYWKPEDHELLAFSYSEGGLRLLRSANKDIDNRFLQFRPKNLWDYCRHKNVYYIDHHQSHAAYAFLSSGYAESDVLAIDGKGSNFNCLFFDKNGNITNLSEKMGIGILWNYFSKKTGLGTMGAGKLMGLSAYGNYSPEFHMIIDYYLNNKFNFPDFNIKNFRTKDIAHTLQVVTEELVYTNILSLKSCDNICISGGVAYNGYINEGFTKHYSGVYVPPAVGDEGQSLGNYMHADYMLNNNVHKPNVYAGKSYEYKGEEKVDIKEVAQAIANGAIVGWFQGKSESGNRALGNRSILADPRNPDIKNIINSTIKMREDFRPFAPSVLEEHYQEYFDTNQPSPYMSRIMPVKSDKIPGVTHIDSTARIQTINRKQNRKYYDLINEFYKITGIPMLLNTSFNCREPIVETPQQAIRTFEETEMDLLVINDYILRKMGR